MSINFRIRPFFGNFWKTRKVPVIDDILLFHEQEKHPTTSFDENCIDFEFQTDRNYYFNLIQTSLASQVKFVKGRGYEI